MPADDGPPSPWGSGPRGSVPQGSGPKGFGPKGFGPQETGRDPPRPRPPWQNGNEPPRWDPPGWWRRLAAHGPANPWLNGRRGLTLLALAAAALWLASGLYRVQPDETGVVQRFGAFVRLTPPGLNYHLPWPVEAVQLPSVTRINRTDIGWHTTDDGQTEQVPHESLMLTGDENIIDINFAVFWRIGDAARYLFATRDPDLTIKDVAESVMREVIGRTPIEPALTDARARIEADVLAKSQAILDRYGTGVQLTQVQLQKVDPPAEVIDSFRDVQRANTEAERMVNEAQSYENNIVPRARGEAAAITAAGDAAAQAAVAQATGDAKRFDSVLSAYRAAPQITLQRLYIETMTDVLTHAPTTVIDSQLKGLLPLLPLGTAEDGK